MFIHSKFIRIKGIILLFLFSLALIPIGESSSKEQSTTLEQPLTLEALYPWFDFSIYLGENDSDLGYGTAVASDGSCYVTGYTKSSSFPTLNAYNSTYGLEGDAFVTKFSVDGVLLWSTFLGGNETDLGYDIAVASDGSCYVTGWTRSNNFPTLNAYNSTYGLDGDVFVAKFSTSGTLLWSTYLGGIDTDYGYGVTIASDDSCYITGGTYSTNFPTLNAFNDTHYGNVEVFITKFSSSGSLLWSTFLGGDQLDWGHGIAVASDDSCYVVGDTLSGNFPTLNGHSDFLSGQSDVFIAKFSDIGSLIWSTFLGGTNDDIGGAIAVTSDDSCYVTGKTSSSNFPMLNPYDGTLSTGGDAFVTKISFDGNLLWSTYLGGNDIDQSHGIAIGSDDSCFITGRTKSSDFPVFNANDDTFGGYTYDAFVVKFASNNTLIWSTFLGSSGEDWGSSIAIASDDSCYVTGRTKSSSFPVYGYTSTYSGDWDAFVSKYYESTTPPPIQTPTPTPSPTPTTPTTPLTTPTSQVSAFILLAVIVIIPILVLRKRKK